MIQVKEIRGGYGEKEVIRGINLEVKQGEFLGILGPNGSGKTTLLKMMAGILAPMSGEVRLGGHLIQSYPPKALAQKVAVLPQKTDQAFSFTVEETVQFGRYPYQKGWLQSVTREDVQVVSKVMEQTGVAQFKNQSIHELSGGEQQRVYLAQALAQQPEYLLLDEPTSFLDLAYQKDLLDLIKEETTSSKLTVIGVFHDVNIASLYCDRLLLLHEGKTDMLGLPHHVLTTERINRVYETNVTPLQHPFRANPQLMVEPAAPSKASIVNIADGWRTYSSEGMTFSINQPLRILSSHKKNGGFFWKRSIGTGTKTLHEQLESAEDLLFFEQANGLAQFAAEDAEDDMILYGMLQQEELAIWLILKRSLSDGAAIQLMGQLMHIMKQETSIPIHHLCIATPNTHETEDADLLHERLGQKVHGLLQTLNAIQK
ncbi:heme ABC transporter ATP-binding protein [Bacillus safensis]|uniref:heme ABC transporter ATP-binding protein n=1 Tax=Bacillus safensis TaxID=561879 RepID=UPI002074F5AC|nr:heme ABC transporter ATP-binding protein [Bacillus safensis]MBY0191167.1 heme ABC transporter ATP-binding protein [Bacillus aerophilus]MED1519152.1 heme ABC transporter ATP-binding protein [Bacillus safensis]USD78503.1 heme ABC transporter ATP-binding protein [Bacillus safensis]